MARAAKWVKPCVKPLTVVVDVGMKNGPVLVKMCLACYSVGVVPLIVNDVIEHIQALTEDSCWWWW